MQSAGRDVPRWQRTFGGVVLGALLLECGYLFISGDDGAALVIAGWTLLCVALIRMLVGVHRPDDGNLKLR